MTTKETGPAEFSQASYFSDGTKLSTQKKLSVRQLTLIHSPERYSVDHQVVRIARKYFGIANGVYDFQFTAQKNRFTFSVLEGDGSTRREYALLKREDGIWTADGDIAIDDADQGKITEDVIDVIIRIKAAANHVFTDPSDGTGLPGKSGDPSGVSHGGGGNTTVIVNCQGCHCHHGNGGGVNGEQIARLYQQLQAVNAQLEANPEDEEALIRFGDIRSELAGMGVDLDQPHRVSHDDSSPRGSFDFNGGVPPDEQGVPVIHDHFEPSEHGDFIDPALHQIEIIDEPLVIHLPVTVESGIQAARQAQPVIQQAQVKAEAAHEITLAQGSKQSFRANFDILFSDFELGVGRGQDTTLIGIPSAVSLTRPGLALGDTGLLIGPPETEVAHLAPGGNAFQKAHARERLNAQIHQDAYYLALQDMQHFIIQYRYDAHHDDQFIQRWTGQGRFNDLLQSCRQMQVTGQHIINQINELEAQEQTAERDHAISQLHTQLFTLICTDHAQLSKAGRICALIKILDEYLEEHLDDANARIAELHQEFSNLKGSLQDLYSKVWEKIPSAEGFSPVGLH